jgi:anti-anti-sigma factor
MSTVDPLPRVLAGSEASVANVEASDLTIRVEHHDGEWFLGLYGELDLVSAAAFDDELERAIEATPTIIVDLSALQFVDSAGMRSLVVACRRAEAERRKLRFLRPPRDVARVLKLTGIDEMLLFLD